MKNTILSEKDAKTIENILLKYGRIASINDLMEFFTENYSKTASHDRIQQLAKAGWFLRIKKGFYLIIDNLSARSTNDMSLLIISQALNHDSYISLATALNYHGMFDQYTQNVTAINYQKSIRYTFHDAIFNFIKINKKYYFGFDQVRLDGKIVNMATKEKALLDYLYLDNGFYSANLIFEKLKNHQNDIDFNKLQKYALQMNTSVQRKIGFLLDRLKINSDELSAGINTKIGYSRFTVDSKTFNSKWRLYYDDRITQ